MLPPPLFPFFSFLPPRRLPFAPLARGRLGGAPRRYCMGQNIPTQQSGRRTWRWHTLKTVVIVKACSLHPQNDSLALPSPSGGWRRRHKRVGTKKRALTGSTFCIRGSAHAGACLSPSHRQPHNISASCTARRGVICAKKVFFLSPLELLSSPLPFLPPPFRAHVLPTAKGWRRARTVSGPRRFPPVRTAPNLRDGPAPRRAGF